MLADLSPEQVLAAMNNFGLGGIVFIIWLVEGRKNEGYKRMLAQVIAMSEQMREDRKELVKIIGDQATILERTSGILSRVEGKLTAIANRR